ncbi:MAG: Crp/Fnr family transcriptional regulator [Planctomycetota bacterium]|nr:MAG: Crp/Fnr family transcriptional regulator [Planctomycetota bacterium]
MRSQPTTIRVCDVFRSLSDHDVHELESRSRLRRFDRGEPIYLPNDAARRLFILLSGRVKICHYTEDGKESILGIVSPGELFGEMALLAPARRGEVAEAIQRCEVLTLPSDAVRQLMHRRPHLAAAIADLVGARRARLENRLKNLLYRSNRERLIALLLDLAAEHGEPNGRGIRLALSLSHQELASIIGATRETVSVLIGALRREGLIDSGRRRIIILQPERLARSVGMHFHPPVSVSGTRAFPRRPVLEYSS